MSIDKTGPVFNSSAQPHSDLPKREHSEAEVHQLLNNYKALAGPESKDEAFMTQLHQHYLSERDAQNMKHDIQRREFQLALECGFQVEAHYSGMIQNQVNQVQEKSAQVVEKAKEYYHTKYSTSKDFREVSKGDRDIDLDNDR